MSTNTDILLCRWCHGTGVARLPDGFRADCSDCDGSGYQEQCRECGHVAALGEFEEGCPKCGSGAAVDE